MAIEIKETEYGVPISNVLSAPADSVGVPSFGTPTESELYARQADYMRPHSRPGSVCVVTAGTLWCPGSWKAVTDMWMHNYKRGLTVWFQEVKDPRSGLPYEHLASMMDHGIVQAMNRGFDYICLLETDVLPEPDLLMHLMGAEVPIIAPIIVDPDTGKAVGSPQHASHTGLKRMKWVPTSFLLFKSNVFHCLAPTIFTGVAGEDMVWERFWYYGHQPFLDTDHPLEMVTHATRSGNLTIDERWEWLKTVDERRRQPADRSSSNPNDPHRNGVYSPWMNNERHSND